MQITTNYSTQNGVNFKASLTPRAYAKMINSIKTEKEADMLVTYMHDGLPGPKSILVDIVKEFRNGMQQTFFELTNTKNKKLPKVRLNVSEFDLPFNLNTVKLFNKTHTDSAQKVWKQYK